MVGTVSTQIRVAGWCGVAVAGGSDWPTVPGLSSSSSSRWSTPTRSSRRAPSPSTASSSVSAGSCDLNVDAGRRGYAFGGISAFLGLLETPKRCPGSGSNVETTSTGADAIFIGGQAGLRVRETPLGADRYLFYEMFRSVGTTPDPFGTDLRGIEVGLDLGLGL